MTAKKLIGWSSSVFLAALFLAPIAWTLFASLMPDDRVFTGVLAPEAWSVESYARVWGRGELAAGALNSVLQIAVIVVLGLAVNTPAAYAFARLEFPGRDVLFAAIVVLVILPIETLAVPLLFTVRDLGLTGGRGWTIAALSLPFAAKAFNIYLLRQYFLELPRELEDAAMIDGASRFRIFTSIAVPAVRPGLAAAAGIDALTHWSDFVWPLLVSTRGETQTIQLALASLFTQPPIAWSEVLAASVIATVPMVALFRFLGRWFVSVDLRSGIR